jgi:hypothetical protein
MSFSSSRQGGTVQGGMGQAGMEFTDIAGTSIRASRIALGTWTSIFP